MKVKIGCEGKEKSNREAVCENKGSEELEQNRGMRMEFGGENIRGTSMSMTEKSATSIKGGGKWKCMPS